MSVEHASAIDTNNGNLLWQDAVHKEVTNSGIVFEVLQAGAVPHRAGTRYPAT